MDAPDNISNQAYVELSRCNNDFDSPPCANGRKCELSNLLRSRVFNPFFIFVFKFQIHSDFPRKSTCALDM